jgi:tRNA dimethylallyltransferase
MNIASATSSLPIICLMGPTASGKTALAIELAKHLQGEVISVDSALIYKDMNIGTAKPDEHEQQGVKHWLIDILSPEQSYSVADFVNDAGRCIEDIIARGKTPILTGGTMMYFNALIHGISVIPASDPAIRADINSSLLEHGTEWLHQALAKVDPVSASRIHQNDPQRITRALEVFRSTNKPLSQWQEQKKPALPYDFMSFSIMPSKRSDLHQRIAQRFKRMLEQGLIDEVTALQAKYDLHDDLPSMRSVGYRQTLQYLAGDFDLQTLELRGIIATRQLAKRQITWLRGWDNVHQMDTDAPDNLAFILQKLSAIDS